MKTLYLLVRIIFYTCKAIKDEHRNEAGLSLAILPMRKKDYSGKRVESITEQNVMYITFRL